MKKSLLFATMLTVAASCSFCACSDDDEDTGTKVIIDTTESEIKTFEYTINLNLGESYEGKELSIDLNAIAAEFGYADSAELVAALSSNDVTGFALTSDGEVDAVNGATTTNGVWGHWFAASGNATTWGATDESQLAAVFAEFNIDTENNHAGFGCGQYPGRITEATTITVTEGLKNEEVSVYVKINFVIATEQYDDPETAPSGTPADAEYTKTFSKAYSNDYAAETIDVKEELRNAWKMTTYQIYQAIKNGEVNAYMNAVADTVPTYTADAPGFWINDQGQSTSYSSGEACIWTSLSYDKTELNLGGGNHPEYTKTAEVKYDFILVYNGTKVTYHITYQLEGTAAINAEQVASYDLAVTVPVDTENYSGASVTFDYEAVCTALGVDTLASSDAMTINTEGNIVNTLNADNGFWYDMSGNFGSWGDNASIWVGYNEKGSLLVGQYPGHSATGAQYIVKFGFLNADKTKYVLFNVTATFQ